MHVWDYQQQKIYTLGFNVFFIYIELCKGKISVNLKMPQREVGLKYAICYLNKLAHQNDSDEFKSCQNFYTINCMFPYSLFFQKY